MFQILRVNIHFQLFFRGQQQAATACLPATIRQLFRYTCSPATIILALLANWADICRRSQEEPRGARRSKEEPGGARRSQWDPGGARDTQEDIGGATRSQQLSPLKGV
jgi:hypothetical protein